MDVALIVDQPLGMGLEVQLLSWGLVAEVPPPFALQYQDIVEYCACTVHVHHTIAMEFPELAQHTGVPELLGHTTVELGYSPQTAGPRW